MSTSVEARATISNPEEVERRPIEELSGAMDKLLGTTPEDVDKALVLSLPAGERVTVARLSQDVCAISYTGRGEVEPQVVLSICDTHPRLAIRGEAGLARTRSDAILQEAVGFLHDALNVATQHLPEALEYDEKMELFEVVYTSTVFSSGHSL